jgi:hypothetical protein
MQSIHVENSKKSSFVDFFQLQYCCNGIVVWKEVIPDMNMAIPKSIKIYSRRIQFFDTKTTLYWLRGGDSIFFLLRRVRICCMQP